MLMEQIRGAVARRAIVRWKGWKPKSLEGKERERKLRDASVLYWGNRRSKEVLRMLKRLRRMRKIGGLIRGKFLGKFYQNHMLSTVVERWRAVVGLAKKVRKFKNGVTLRLVKGGVERLKRHAKERMEERERTKRADKIVMKRGMNMWRDGLRKRKSIRAAGVMRNRQKKELLREVSSQLFLATTMNGAIYMYLCNINSKTNQ